MSTEALGTLRSLIAKHACMRSGPLDALPMVALGRETVVSPPCPHLVGPVFSLIAQGRKRMTLGARDIHYGVGEAMVVSVDLPLDAQVVQASEAEPFLGFGLTLRPTPIAELLLAQSAVAPDSPDRFAVHPVAETVLAPIIRLLQLLDSPGDIQVLAPGIEREILWRLLHGPHGWLIRQIGLSDSHVARVGRATQWLRDHLADTVKVEAVAEIAGMSATSFHRHFRAVTGLTPIQYQKHLRLQAARTRLMAERADIAELSYAVGYNSPSQFSRDYRRLFGKSPAQDGADFRSRSKPGYNGQASSSLRFQN